MARNLSLAIGRSAPSAGFRNVFGQERTASPVGDRPHLSLRSVFATIRETIAVIAAAGRVGRAVQARRAPSADDLKTAGLEHAGILRAPYRF